jgi:hypothetical protein
VPYNYAGGVLTLTLFLFRLKALTFSNQGLLILVGDCPIWQLVLCEKDFGSLGVEPRVFGLLWLMASATWGGGGEITSAEGLHDWGRRGVPLLNYTVAFTIQPRKSSETLSQGSLVVGD